MAKPTISTTAGVTKEEGPDQKNFHYLYILKKTVPKVEEPTKPPPEPKKEDEGDEGKSESNA